MSDQLHRLVLQLTDDAIIAKLTTVLLFSDYGRAEWSGRAVVGSQSAGAIAITNTIAEATAVTSDLSSNKAS